MTFLGDFAVDQTFDLKFCTVSATGAPTQLAGTPVVSAYVDNSTTQVTAGITLSVDFDGVTGLNNVRVVATTANGYPSGSNFQLVITTGTVGGISVVGYVVGQFSINARSALRPTTPARTLDVSAGGEAGLDWANIGSPTTAQNLSGTNIDVDQVVASVSGAVGSVTGAVGSVTGAVGSVTGNVGGNVTGSVGSVVATVTADVDTIKTNPVANAGTVTFPTNATLASTTNITAGTIATVTNLTNAPANGDLTATMKTSVQTAAAAALTAYDAATATDVTTSQASLEGDIAAVPADVLTAAVADPIKADIQEINAVAIIGDGAGTPWGP